MRALVTGSAGFIGGALCRRLRRENYSVCCLDVPEGDVRITSRVISAARDCDVIFHEASRNLVDSIDDPNADADTNIHGAINVLRAAQAWGCTVVMASTGSVHPQGNGIPGTPYGISKLAAEHYARYYREYHDVNVKVLRYFSVYGPGMPTERRGVIGIFLKKVMAGDEIIVEGGQQERSFCFIDDIVDANLAVVDGDDFLYEVGTDAPVTIADLAYRIATDYGKTTNIVFRDARPGDDERMTADTRALEALGWEAKVSLDEGIERTARWISQS